MCKISVIMGCYNPTNEGILYKAVTSILQQTVSDFEFIICDDGSNETGRKIIESLKKMDTRIKVIHNSKNKGLAFSLNRCIRIAKGEYIARMDDDDISLPYRFEKEMEFLMSNTNIAFVGCNVNYIDDNDMVWGNRIMKLFPTAEDFLMTSQFVHPSVMIRSSVLKQNGGYSVEKITRRAEDYELWMRLYARGYKGANIDEILLYYREGKKGLKKRKFCFRVDEMIVRYEGFKQNNLLPKGLLYVIKPIFVWLLPSFIIKLIHKHLSNYYG